MILHLKKSFTLLTFVILFSFSNSSLGYLWGATPLMEAAQRADLKAMQGLIKQGADVNAVCGQEDFHAGSPVLRYAIDSGSLEAVRILLAAGANPNNLTESPLIYDDTFCHANVRNLSMLSHAVNSGAPIAIIQELIKYGAHSDGTPKTMGDWSSLMIASFRGYKEAVIVLLQAGADASAVNSMDNKTALDYAQEMEHKEIIKLLETK